MNESNAMPLYPDTQHLCFDAYVGSVGMKRLHCKAIERQPEATTLPCCVMSSFSVASVTLADDDPLIRVPSAQGGGRKQYKNTEVAPSATVVVPPPPFFMANFFLEWSYMIKRPDQQLFL